MIPVNEPMLVEDDIRNVMDCVRSGWVSSSGRYIEQFESEWAAACGAKYGVAVSNGTAALQIGMECLELQPGDEVIVPTFTIISCVMAIVRAGASPVLVDSEPRTWCIDVERIEAQITARTRVIMPVHVYGHPADMDRITQLAHKYGLRVFEDAAEVHGAEYLSGRDSGNPTWRRCGGIGDLAAFSFYANKLITTGEGGMVVTCDNVLAERLRSLRNLCFQPPRRFYHTQLGYNFRLTNLQAALGLAQVRRLASIVNRKREIARRYTQRLRKLEWLELPQEESWARSVFWVYGMVIRDDVPLDSDGLAGRLATAGIETRPFFLGMHEQPVFHRRGLFANSSGQFPVAERLARRGLYVPAGLAVTDAQIDAVCGALEQISHEI